MICIYQIRNLLDSKIYVGSTKNAKNRFKSHKSNLKLNKHHAPHLQHAWNKYGESNFTFEILEILNDINSLSEKEQFWLDKTQCYNSNFGYNVGVKAIHAMLGRKHSDISKKKMIEKLIGNKYNLGNSASEEAKINMSKAQLGRKHPEEVKLKISNSHKGKKFSKEHILNMSLSRIGKPVSKEIKNLLLSHARKPNVWPCELGIKCKCESCLHKKKERLKIYNKTAYSKRKYKEVKDEHISCS